MLKIIVEKWDENKNKLKKIFETGKGFNDCTYKDIVKLTFDVIFNTGSTIPHSKLDLENIVEIDNGDYQGTLLYIIPFNTYQPSESEYLLTFIEYGSCSICDTLQAIQSEAGELLSAAQVSDFMKLSKDILQNTIKPYNSGWREEEDFKQVEVDK